MGHNVQVNELKSTHIAVTQLSNSKVTQVHLIKCNNKKFSVN